MMDTNTAPDWNLDHRTLPNSAVAAGLCVCPAFCVRIALSCVCLPSRWCMMSIFVFVRYRAPTSTHLSVSHSYRHGRADPTTSIPGTSPGITAHDHCFKQGLPELASETEIGPCNYQREGTTFVDSIENYLSRGTQLSPAEPETFQYGRVSYCCYTILVDKDI